MERQIKKLLSQFNNFQFTDIIGFARILGVEEKDDFVEFCTEICFEFAKQTRKRRRQLLKLAQDIGVANANMEKHNPLEKLGKRLEEEWGEKQEKQEEDGKCQPTLTDSNGKTNLFSKSNNGECQHVLTDSNG